MPNCKVVATFTPKPEYLEVVSAFLLEVDIGVRQEPGCQYYDLYQEVSGKLLFIEAWESRELWQIHNNAPSVAKLRGFVENKLLEPLLVQEMYQL
jgi:quinol monooxygenase YgiN